MFLSLSCPHGLGQMSCWFRNDSSFSRCAVHTWWCLEVINKSCKKNKTKQNTISLNTACPSYPSTVRSLGTAASVSTLADFARANDRSIWMNFSSTLNMRPMTGKGQKMHLFFFVFFLLFWHYSVLPLVSVCTRVLVLQRHRNAVRPVCMNPAFQHSRVLFLGASRVLAAHTGCVNTHSLARARHRIMSP